MQTVTTTVNLPDDQLAEIGRVAVLWSHFEWQFEDCIHRLSGVSKKRARIMTQGMPVRPRILTIRGLMQERGLAGTPLANKFEAVAHQVTDKNAENERNTVVHSLWHLGKGNKQWYAVRTAGSWSPGPKKKVRRSVLPESTPMGRNQLIAVSNRLISLMMQMKEFNQGLRSALAPSRGKSR